MINKFAAHDDAVVEGVHDAFDRVYGGGVSLCRKGFNLWKKFWYELVQIKVISSQRRSVLEVTRLKEYI